MFAQPPLRAERFRARIKIAVDGVIARHRLEQVVRPMSIFRSVVLLRIKTGAGENAIEQTRGNLVRDDGFDRWPADVKPRRLQRAPRRQHRQ